MKRKLMLKKCLKCGSIVKIMKDCNCQDCGIQCCSEEMRLLIPNTVDAAVEKHIPTYKKQDGKIIVKVNHVMEENHFIEWISMVSENQETTVYLKPQGPAEVEFDYLDDSVLYAYCNQHGLWETEIK